MFDLLGGLPLHPLVVHGVVVLLPLAAVGRIITTVGTRWRTNFQWVILFGVVAGTVGSYIAKISGDSLSAAVGLADSVRPVPSASVNRARQRASAGTYQ
ncbi:MAG: hypothetical protein NWQ96_08735 [Candidatus Nanopelagicales bacterium]|nr:hypothetical protein [Candidatus Nanopelagicales bacterium]